VFYCVLDACVYHILLATLISFHLSFNHHISQCHLSFNHHPTHSDYSGFPEESHELPIDYMTEEHREVIAKKCSHPKKKKKFPNLPTSKPAGGSGSLLATSGGDISAITPPPAHSRAVANGQSSVVVNMAGSGGGGGGKGGKKKKGTVTPVPPKGESSAAKGNSKKAAAGGGKKPAAKPAAKLSKSAMESHRKWQAEAEKQGGPNAKIVVSKPEAKKIIFEKLYDEFTPMNINGV